MIDPTDDAAERTRGTRRHVLLGAGATLTAGLAGCSGADPGDGDDDSNDDGGENGDDGARRTRHRNDPAVSA